MKIIYPLCYYFPIFAVVDEYDDLIKNTRSEEKRFIRSSSSRSPSSRKAEGFIDLFLDIDDEYAKLQSSSNL